MKKIFLAVSFLLVLWGKWDSAPCLKQTIFTIKTEWDSTPDICGIYPNSMIYLPVKFYAFCPVLSGVTQNFSTKCLIMPRTTLLDVGARLYSQEETGKVGSTLSLLLPVSVVVCTTLVMVKLV